MMSAKCPNQQQIFLRGAGRRWFEACLSPEYSSLQTAKSINSLNINGHTRTLQETFLKEISQVGIVVRDLRKAVEHYWKLFGIGPWKIYTYAPPRLSETMIRGKRQHYSMRIALSWAGPLMLELIEPLEGNSIYKEFLTEGGEGIHHLASHSVRDVDKAIAQLQNQGIGILQSGKYSVGDFSVFFAYMNTEKTLGIIVELLKLRGNRPEPEATYP